MRNRIILLLFVLFNNPSTAQIEIMKKFTPGDYGVGFKDERITDYSRLYENGYRSIQLFVWYPTKEKTLKTLQYEQYFMINDPKGTLLDSRPSNNMMDSLIQKEIKNLNKSNGIQIRLSNYKALKTIAQPEAPALEGNKTYLYFKIRKVRISIDT